MRNFNVVPEASLCLGCSKKDWANTHGSRIAIGNWCVANVLLFKLAIQIGHHSPSSVMSNKFGQRRSHRKTFSSAEAHFR
jgi:hypothetical protein